jgi:hypothetical protein
MKTKYKTRFERIFLNNRWRRYPYGFSGDWTIIGIQQYYSGWDSFFIGICFFGLELRFWFKKEKTK